MENKIEYLEFVRWSDCWRSEEYDLCVLIVRVRVCVYYLAVVLWQWESGWVRERETERDRERERGRVGEEQKICKKGQKMPNQITNQGYIQSHLFTKYSQC